MTETGREGQIPAPETPTPRRRPPSVLALLLSGLLLGAVALIFASGRWRQGDQQKNTTAPLEPTSPLVFDPSAANASPLKLTLPVKEVSNPGYVGMDSCAPCHAERVNEFRSTNHFQTCREPEPARMEAGFGPGENRFETRYPDLRFEMDRQGDRFYQTSIRGTPIGDIRTSARIDLIYGAGDADEVLLSWKENGELFELPVARLTTTKEWAVSHFDPHANGEFSRPLTLRCFECHMTWFDYLPGSVNTYQKTGAILGVTCECCHGPAQDHVRHHADHPQETAPYAIVQPATLSRDRQTDLCVQCHGNYINAKGPALAYRPGEPLQDHYREVNSPYSEDDHVANQIKYMKQSACYLKSDTLTCITCHDPHTPTDNAHTAIVREACLQCHQPADCGEQPKLPESLRADCSGCHMPKRVKVNVNFQTADDDFVSPIHRFDHRIAVHEVARDEMLLAWYRQQPGETSRDEAQRLTRSLIDHWTREAESNEREYRFLAATAAIREAINIEKTPQLVERLKRLIALQVSYTDLWNEARHQMSGGRNADAIATLKKILAMRPTDAKAHGKLGLLYAMSGKRESAIQELEAVAKHDPEDPYGHGLLGWIAYLEDRPDEAIAHYQLAIEIEPYYDKLRHQMGLALVKLDRPDEALEQFNLALKINPDRGDTSQQIAMLLLQRGDVASALPFARHGVERSSGQELQPLIVLADALAAGGQPDEAASLLQRAAASNLQADPQTVRQLRSRLQRLQAIAPRDTQP